MPDRTARIDLEAISHNVARLRDLTTAAHFIAVVKADGYGHGAESAARAAIAGGTDLLAVADIDEAVRLRSVGIAAPILCWLHGSGEDFTEAVRLGLDIGLSSLDQIDTVALAARSVRSRARVHLKVDTGLSRNGTEKALVREAARKLAFAGSVIDTAGVFTHLSNTSAQSDAASLEAFDTAVAAVRAAGLRPAFVHAAATAACFSRHRARYNTVRVGLGIYGIRPDVTSAAPDPQLRPAMMLSSRVVGARKASAGDGVGYEHLWVADRQTTLALVPLGYADGLPRAAHGRAEVLVRGIRFPVVGRVAMDQCVVDVGSAPVEIGDEVVVWGGPDPASPSVQEWAEWSSTISYELLVGVGNRVTRVAA